MPDNTSTNNTDSQQAWETRYNWDFFISHPGPDTGHAEILYNALNPPARVFLDSVSMVPGDNFDSTLPDELEASLISVILITPNTEKAYYAKEEIAMAIDMARADRNTHRVVPVYLQLNGEILQDMIPFGLRQKNSLYIKNSADFAKISERLLLALKIMKRCELKKDEEVTRKQEAVMMVTNPANSVEFFIGFNEIVSFVRVPLLLLASLFTITLAALIIVAISNAGRKDLLLLILGSFCAFFAFGFFWFIARAFKLAPQIANGKINAN
jgi:hypothetical protein